MVLRVTCEMAEEWEDPVFQPLGLTLNNLEPVMKAADGTRTKRYEQDPPLTRNPRC